MPVVYEIVCNITNKRYIGSTLNTLETRIIEHKSSLRCDKYCDSHEIIKLNDYNVNVLEYINNIEQKELWKKEQSYMDKLECVNKKRAYRSPEDLKKWKKEYNSVIIFCECGGKYRRSDKGRHFKTELHKKFNL